MREAERIHQPLEFKLRPLALSIGKEVRHIAAASAYQARARLRAGARCFDFSDRKEDLLLEGIRLPANATSSFRDRQALCDAMQIAPAFVDGLVARWIVADFPVGMCHPSMIALTEAFCETMFVQRGMAVDFAIHDPAKAGRSGAAHLHVLLSAHEIGTQGFGTYRRDWQDKLLFESWNRDWQVWSRHMN